MNKRLALIGYGSQGRAEALNFKRSGIDFRLGLRPGPSWERAKKDGFEPLPPEDALQDAAWVFLNINDQNQADFFNTFIRPYSSIKYVVFAHGFNIHFKLIPTSDPGPTMILIAPKGAASGLTEFYKTDSALPAILAIEPQNRDTPELRKDVEALACELGCHPKKLVWARFRDETVCDLFSEQTLLCGGVSSLLRRAYEVLIEAGYDRRAAYYETLFELKLIVDLIWKYGITGMRERISPTARYGDITRGDRIIDETVKQKMKSVLQEIESGEFAHEFLKDFHSKKFQAQEAEQKEHPLEIKGRDERDQPPLFDKIDR